MKLDALNANQRAIYDRTVRGTHHRAVELEVYRRSDGKAVLSLTNKFLGGQIQGDESRTPVTFMSCELIDDDYALDWAHGDHRKFEVQVVDSRFVPDLDDWVETPVFRGPIWDFSRDDVLVSLVAEGPERNAEGSIRNADWWPAKTRATVVLKALLRKAGATGLQVPNLKATLPRSVTIGVRLGKPDPKAKKDKRPVRQRFLVDRTETYWSQAEEIAQSLDRDLYGDARGKFVLAHPRTRPSIRLDERTILGPVREKRADEGEQTNVWIVTGPNPKGPRPAPRARVELPKQHPASAHQQRWNDKPREIIELIENKHVRTDAQARKLGQRKRDRALREVIAYEVEALPIIPWVRPWSLMSVPTSSGRASGRIRSWTLPLGPGADPLVLGAAKRRRWSR